MSPLLRRATLATAAVAVFSTTLERDSSCPCRPLPTIFRSSSPPAYCNAPGHLGLARDHRGLRALLTPEALFLDATHALASGALGHKPFSGEMIRQLRDDARGIIAKDWPGPRAEEVEELRLNLALVDAEDGRFVDALNALDRLADERPSDPRPRICASVICCFVGLPDEGEEFLEGIPDDILQEYKVYHKRAVMAAALGGAPGAIAGLEGLVASMAFESMNSALEAKYLDGGISKFTKALQSAVRPVLLRAHPLSGERLRDARRAAERDLARAVEEGDGPAAADLRLLLGLFAARDGRFDDALELYAAVARDDPADPRPHALGLILCGVVGRWDEFRRWRASYERFVCLAHIPAELLALQDEVIVAAALGGALYESADDESMPSSVKRLTRLVVYCAWRKADAGMAAALREKQMTIVKTMQVQVARVLLRAGTRSLLKEMDAKLLEKQQEEEDIYEEV
ncbi:hypothetical protein QYE76_043507 [Lolium multiflorum]|uniref:Uncharacterized protein n=1 Tax=Lolium multiflorum TaxID=4521 RepID=A0AAD8TH77_LOLMU|nr:hypothetical protein QYE76_043507 [Lolium multiflorum]